jgi:hypothetical protein
MVVKSDVAAQFRVSFPGIPPASGKWHYDLQLVTIRRVNFTVADRFPFDLG